jgi:hypothetical protein
MNSATKKFATALCFSLVTSDIPQLLALSSLPQHCQERMYSAPDGRLSPHIIGRLPKSAEPVVGFEIIRGKPVVALPRQLLVFSEKSIDELSVSEQIEGIAFNQESQLVLQTETGFLTIGKTGLQPDKTKTSTVHGRLYGSGSPVFVELRARQGLVQFVARNQRGDQFLITTVKGTLHAASWNDRGLAAVAGDSLYVWSSGAKNIVRLVTDRGLTAAQDVVLVGLNRAVVTLRSTVVLVTSETIAVVAGMPRARCRFQQNNLYLLDGQSRLIWSLEGLDQIGRKNEDQAYASHLLEQLAPNADESAVEFQEAARILGCVRARQELANLRTTAPRRPNGHH